MFIVKWSTKWTVKSVSKVGRRMITTVNSQNVKKVNDQNGLYCGRSKAPSKWTIKCVSNVDGLFRPWFWNIPILFSCNKIKNPIICITMICNTYSNFFPSIFFGFIIRINFEFAFSPNQGNENNYWTKMSVGSRRTIDEWCPWNCFHPKMTDFL